MKRIIILLSVLLLLPVWSQSEIKQPGRTTLSKGLTPYVPEISTDHAPKVRHLAKQLLALIDSMHTEEDFSVQSIQKNSGIRLNEYPDHPNSAYLGKKLTDQWGIFLHRFVELDGQPAFSMEFSPKHIPSNIHLPSGTDICLDLGRFHQALQKMGYQHTGNFRGSRPGIQYQRERIYVAFTYASENKNRDSHDCIISFSIYINKHEQQP